MSKQAVVSSSICEVEWHPHFTSLNDEYIVVS
jgi:hypothetical protein